jgi:hypothetical protein
LYCITELPLNRDAEVLRYYPAFKLGVTSAVRHYAQLLLPFVQKLMATDTGWILTSQALAAHTPAAANLLCWELFDLYTRENGSGQLTVIDLQYDNEATASIDYAKLNVADRITERERLSRRLVQDAGFQGRPVLFVNDIRITGAQQHTMQQYFDHVEAACVKWVYLMTVDPELGRTKPEIEWEINFAPFEDLLRMVSREEIQFTGKCVLKLMELSVAKLERILRALSSERRKRLLELAVQNNFHNLESFQDQIKLLRSSTDRAD